ncbi:hypothetical protein [Streptomyces sp. OE57]|uniref:hypothetical protein n=1 Tax=Streptomyces lacaronensis TaxID=3379885 RepID=UPI0039B7536B
MVDARVFRGPAAVIGATAVEERDAIGGAVFIEGLAKLDQLPAIGAHFPFPSLKIPRSSGGRGRAVGWLPAAR